MYLLCKELIRAGLADPAGNDLYAVFVSNEEKKVILSYILYYASSLSVRVLLAFVSSFF